jgi:hypothetical protein
MSTSGTPSLNVEYLPPFESETDQLSWNIKIGDSNPPIIYDVLKSLTEPNSVEREIAAAWDKVPSIANSQINKIFHQALEVTPLDYRSNALSIIISGLFQSSQMTHILALSSQEIEKIQLPELRNKLGKFFRKEGLKLFHKDVVEAKNLLDKALLLDEIPALLNLFDLMKKEGKQKFAFQYLVSSIIACQGHYESYFKSYTAYAANSYCFSLYNRSAKEELSEIIIELEVLTGLGISMAWYYKALIIEEKTDANSSSAKAAIIEYYSKAHKNRFCRKLVSQRANTSKLAEKAIKIYQEICLPELYYNRANKGCDESMKRLRILAAVGNPLASFLCGKLIEIQTENPDEITKDVIIQCYKRSLTTIYSRACLSEWSICSNLARQVLDA